MAVKRSMSFTDPTFVDAKSTDIPQTLPVADAMFEMVFADDEVVETPPKPKRSKLTIKCAELDIPPSSGKCADATKSEPVVRRWLNMPMPKKDAAPDPDNMSIWDAWLKETSVIDAAPKETCVIDATPKKTSVKDAAPDVVENSSVKDAWLLWACGKNIDARRSLMSMTRRKEFLAARAVQNSQKSCVDDSSYESDSDASTNAGS